MTVFHLVRHGEKSGGPGDPGLSGAGADEAERTAEHLGGLPVVAVWTSPLRRARETAATIAARHGLQPLVDDRLRERINWGDEGEQTWEEFTEMWDRASRQRDWQPPYGDSSREAGARFEEALAEAAAQHPDGHVVAVAHGGIIGDLLQNRFPVDELDAANGTWADMRTCSLTRVVVEDGRWRLEVLASCDHLD